MFQLKCLDFMLQNERVCVMCTQEILCVFMFQDKYGETDVVAVEQLATTDERLVFAVIGTLCVCVWGGGVDVCVCVCVCVSYD